MNDICNVSEFLFTILYADDTCVLVNGTDLEIVFRILNKELCKLFIWLNANKLSRNVSKTYYVIIHRARIKHPLICQTITMYNNILVSVECCKHLGIILDYKIS